MNLSIAAIRRTRPGIALAVLVASAVLPQASLAAGDPEEGKLKSAPCAACHGQQGIALAPNWPNLAGQYEDYLVHSLHAYRSGDRQNAIMQGFAAALSDEDIEDLAAYFSAQTGPMQTAPRADSN